MEDAACAGTDPFGELFFGPADEHESSTHEPSRAEAHRVERAKAVCAQCPVLGKCLIHALSEPEAYGIWGGLTRWERARLRTRLRRQRASLRLSKAEGY